MSKIRSFYSLFIIFSISFISCSSDNETSVVQESEEEANVPLIISQTTELTFDSGGEPLFHKTIIDGEIMENRSQNLQRRVYVDGELVNDTIHVIYDYDTQNRLILQNRIQQGFHRLYYDTDNKITAIDWKSNNLDMVYFKITHLSENSIQKDRYEEPFTNPGAQISWRIISEFNENGEVIKSGFDQDFDGELDTENTFEYSNGNLTSFTNKDGEIFTISYTDIIDTRSFITQNSFGKKELKIVNIVLYARARIEWFEKVGSFYNVPQKALESSTFNIHESGYYNKRTTISQTNNPDINSTEIEEFEFYPN